MTERLNVHSKQASSASFEQLKNQHSTADSGSREAKLKELASAYDAYMELNSTTKEGNKVNYNKRHFIHFSTDDNYGLLIL